MIAVIKTDSGNYNVFGTENDAFIISGNLTKAQLIDLVNKAAKALKEK
jgi:hypothetical protein